MKTLLLAALLSAASPLLAAPFASSINREPQTTLAVSGSSTVFRVTFTESVTGVDVTDFTLLKVGTVTGTVASISGSGTTYDVTVNGISGFGTLRLDLKHTGTGIEGSGAVALADGFDNGQVIRVGTATPIGWGGHSVGQIGDGTAAGGTRAFPTAVDTSGVLSGKNIVQMASGANWTLALTADNLLFAWGSNANGQFGNGNTTTPAPASPVAVPMTGVLSGKTIIKIACGDGFGMALDSNGLIYSWGVGTSGQLGDGLSTTGSTPVAVSTSGALSGKVVTDIAGGTAFAIACTSDGGIYTWGNAGTGRLGNGTTSGNVTTPAQLGGVFTGKRVVAVSGGGTFGAALTSDGRVYTWGNNTLGQLGDGGTLATPTNNATPAGILGTGLLPGSKPVASITCTNSCMYAIARDGTLYAWGGGGSGGLGNGGTTSSTTPVLVDTTGVLSGKTIAAINGGNNFAEAITTEGKAYSWGTNASAQLGDGTTNQQNNPIAVNVSASSALNGKTISFLSQSGQGVFTIMAAGAAAAPTAPEIGVTESGNDVPDGGAFAFGTTTVGAPVTKTFTITNTGDAVLNLSGLTPPSGFTIAQNFGSSTVAASGGTTTFQITMTAAAASTPSGTLTFTNDDANEGTYNFTISGTVNPAPVAVTSLTRSNGSPTNASTVNWTLTFAGPVSGLTASNFSLTGAAATGSVVGTPTTSNNIAWGIPVTTGSTDGTLTLNLANATGLSTTISTALPFAGDSYTIDKTAPTVLSVTRLSPSGQNTNATTVTFRVTYSEPVALNAPATSRFQVVPVNGSNIAGTVTGVTGTTNTRDVTVNLTSGTGEFRLRVLD